MPVPLFIFGNFWLAATLAFGFGSSIVSVLSTTGQPQTYRFLGTDHSVSPNTYYSGLFILLSASVTCFVLSYMAWRRQHNPPMQSTGAERAFPVIPASDESSTGH